MAQGTQRKKGGKVKIVFGGQRLKYHQSLPHTSGSPGQGGQNANTSLWEEEEEVKWSRPRSISTGQLSHCCVYTSSLLRGDLPRTLPGYPVGELILGGASCLDAFSAYPFPA